MRVKWNRNLDGSQAQQKSDEQATDSAQEKGAVPDRPPSGGFLKIFRLKRHKKTKHGELPDDRQHSANDSPESCRPIDDNISRSELAVLPSDDNRTKSVCEDSEQFTCGTGLLRSVSVSQSRRGSEDYSDLKYRSLPSVGKGWFSFTSRKSWLNLSGRARRGSKDEKKISASAQSIPAKSLRKTEKLIEENLLRESPERPVKCYSENPFPLDDNRDNVLSTPLREQRKGSLRSKDDVTALSTCNQVDDVKSPSVVVEGNDLEYLPKDSDKTGISKFSASGKSCVFSSPNGEQNYYRNNKDQNAPIEIFSKLPVPQCVGKANGSSLNKCAEISTDKKSYPEEIRQLKIAPEKAQVPSLVPFLRGKNSETLQNRKVLPQFVENESCQKSNGDSRPKDCDLLPSIAGNHHPSKSCEQSVTNDTLFHSVTRSSKEDAEFSISQDRTFVCQTEHEQVTVERNGGHNNSLPRRDNGEKNQQRNGIPSRLSTAGFESSAGQMKSLGSGTSTGGDRLESWPAEVTHRTAAVADASKDGRDVLSPEHQIPNSVMFCCTAELPKKPTENNCTKWYVPICDALESTDSSCAIVIPPKFLNRVNTSPTVCESSEPLSGGDKKKPKHVFDNQVSENSDLFINITSDRTESSCEEKEVFRDGVVAGKLSAREDSEKQTSRFLENSNSELADPCTYHYNGVCCDRMNSDTKMSLGNTCLEILDMNERNISFSHCENGLKNNRSTTDKDLCAVAKDLDVSSCVSQDQTENTTNFNSAPDNSTFSEFLISADAVAKDLEKLCVAYNNNNNGVLDSSSPETLEKQMPDCSLILYNLEKISNDVKNNLNSNNSLDDSSASCQNFQSTPEDEGGNSNSKVLDDTYEVDPTEAEEIIRQVEDMISASFESCCCESLEIKPNYEKNVSASDLKSKIRKFPLFKDVVEDILEKSVSSDSGISEEIQEICSEELKYANHHHKEEKSVGNEGETVGTSLHPSVNLEETGKNKVIFHVDYKQLHVHKQGSIEEETAEKHTNQNNCYSKQQPVLDISNKSHESIVMVNNHVQGGDVEICSAQLDNNLPEIDNSSLEIDDVQNGSINKGTKSSNQAIPEELNGVTEQTNNTDHSHKYSVEETVQVAEFPINVPHENVILPYSPPPRLPFCSNEIEPPIDEKLFPEYFKSSTERERFYEKTFFHFDGFSWENFRDPNQTIRIYTLSHSDFNRMHRYIPRGDRTSHVVDIFSSDYTSTYIFCSRCCCCDVLYSSYVLPYPIHHQDISFLPKFVKHHHFNSFIRKSRDVRPLADFDELVSLEDTLTIECIPVSPTMKQTFSASDEVTLVNNKGPPDGLQRNATVDLPPEVNCTSHIPDVKSETDDVHTADNDTKCEPVLSCETKTFIATCVVELKPAGSTAVFSEETDCKVNVNNSLPNSDVQPHLPKQVKEPSLDKTDSPSKDRMVLRKSRIPRRKHGSVRVLHHPSPKPVRPPMWLSRAELSQEIQHLGTLCEARTKELNLLKMKLKHATLGFDAFAAVFKYLTEDLDALSHPQLVIELAKTQKLLHQAKNDILCYEKQIEELKSHHAKELAELSEKMLHVYQSELQQVTNKQNEELSLLEQQHQKKMVNLQTSYVEAAEKAKTDHKKEVEEIRQKFLKQKEEAELLHQSEMKHLEESHLEVQKSLQAEIEQLKVQYAESKQQSRNIEETLQKDTDTKLQWISSKKAELDKEVDSLKAVLEMKNNEIHSLRKENLEMQKELEELPVAKEKIKMLQARAEDLQALMAEKVRVERQLSTEHQTMKEIYEKESKTNKRLSMENEELQWRLKQQASELSLRSQTNSPDVLETPSPPKSPWQQQPPQQQNSRSKFFTYVDPSECDPESPQAKSPAPLTASRSKFFTFVDPSEYDSQSPHSPRYKRLTPSSMSSPCKQIPLKNPLKLPLTSTPRKSKVSTEAQSGGGTPRKVSKKQGGKTSPVYLLPRSSDEEAVDICNVANNIPESMESSISSEDSSLPPRDLEDPMCTSTKELPNDKIADFASMAYDKSPKPESDVSILGEATDPKKYYHMTFPVLKETGTDCDADDANSFLLLENAENCFVTSKEIDDPGVKRNGYANDMTGSELDDMHPEVEVSDLKLEEVVSHRMDSGVSEKVNRIISNPCENVSTRDGSDSQDVTMHTSSAFVNEDSKATGEVADS